MKKRTLTGAAILTVVVGLYAPFVFGLNFDDAASYHPIVHFTPPKKINVDVKKDKWDKDLSYKVQERPEQERGVASDAKGDMPVVSRDPSSEESVQKDNPYWYYGPTY